MGKLKMSYMRYSVGLIICLSIAISSNACSSKDVDYTPPPGSTETAITHYSFGMMVIDGKTYESDLIIHPGGKVTRWSFELSTHEISVDDLKRYISDKVKILIIGKGYEGAAYLSSSTMEMIEKLKSKGVVVHALTSSEAVVLFNSSDKEGLLAFFHLNC
jgi:hypothetical protein